MIPFIFLFQLDLIFRRLNYLKENHIFQNECKFNEMVSEHWNFKLIAYF